MKEGPKKEKGLSPFEKQQQAARGRALRMGGYSAAVSVTVVAIAAAIVLLMGELPATVTKLDFTSQQLLHISEQTQMLLQSLPDEIQIYVIVSGGSEDLPIMELIGRYEARSDKIRVIRVDPVISPNFAAQYTDEEVLDNSLVVKRGDLYKYVGYNDIYQADYSNLEATGTYETYFNGESAITGAISYVMREDVPRVYNLTGHGEIVLGDKLVNDIENANMEIRDLDLLTVQSIPEDADCLIAAGPKADFSEEEKNMLLLYLKEGGKMLLFTDYAKTPMPHLKEITDYYGVETVDGIVVEADTEYCMGNYYQYLLPHIYPHAITDPFVRNNYRVLTPIAQGLQMIDTVRDSVDVDGLLRTSAASFSKLAGYDMTTYAQEEGDINGPFGIGMAITEPVNDADETMIVWYSTSNLLNEDANNVVSGANWDMVLNSLSWMCEQEGSIGIRAKSLDEEMLVVSARESTILSLILIFVLPAAFIAAGIVVSVRRRSL